MSRPSRTRALLATLRIANAPSVVSNVLLGYVVGFVLWWGFWRSPETMDSGVWSFARLCLSGVLLYFSGNLANDWFDRHWDRERRPERALPAGCFKPGSYLIAALLAASGGVSLAFYERFACGVCALVIVCLIAIYTWLHKQTLWAVVPMGFCRAGLYVMGAMRLWVPPWQAPVFDELFLIGIPPSMGMPVVFQSIAIVSTISIGLASYIAGLSLSARYESMPDPPPGPKALSLAMLVLPFAAMSCWFVPYSPYFGLLGMLPFAIWLSLCLTRFRKPVSRYVSALLAGIPLVDFIAIALIVAATKPYPFLGTPEIWCPPSALLLTVPLLAFILGRLLQRLAPAT